MNPVPHLFLSVTLAIVTLIGAPTSGLTAAGPDRASESPSAFTGEILPVFYVCDVLASVDFYVNKLGFLCDHFFDHINGGSVDKWTSEEPPLYAEMWAGGQRFALHRASRPDSLMVGGMRMYFGVDDVRAHRQAVVSKGVEAGEIVERSWMHMYRVVDPDGHELFIFTRPPGWDE